MFLFFYFICLVMLKLLYVSYIIRVPLETRAWSSLVKRSNLLGLAAKTIVSQAGHFRVAFNVQQSLMLAGSTIHQL